MPFIIIDEHLRYVPGLVSKGYNCQTLHVDKNFDVSAYPFLDGITYLDEGQSQLFVASQFSLSSSSSSSSSSSDRRHLPSRYIIQSPGLVFLMNEFEKCGYSLVNQTSDKWVGMRVMMHNAISIITPSPQLK